MGLSQISASNGSGEAVRAAVTVIRISGSTTLSVDSLINWPASFIATSGVQQSDGTLSGAFVFAGHKSGATIVIDSFAPGYADPGNSEGDVVLLKPSTLWADIISTTLQVSHNDDGTIKTATINGIKTSVLTDPGVLTDKRIKPRSYAVSTTATLAPDLASYNIFSVTALAGSMTISAPASSPSDGEVIVFRFKDNGTSRAIAWDSVFTGIGDSLTTSTSAGKWHYANGMYNATTSKWDMLPTIIEG